MAFSVGSSDCRRLREPPPPPPNTSLPSCARVHTIGPGHGRAESDREHPQPSIGRLVGRAQRPRAVGIGTIGQQDDDLRLVVLLGRRILTLDQAQVNAARGDRRPEWPVSN